MTLRFEDPPPAPPRQGTRRDWAAIAAELRRRPVAWAVVAEGVASRPSAANMTVRIRKGIFKAFRPAGHYEAQYRAVDGTYRVYARFVGEKTGGGTP